MSAVARRVLVATSDQWPDLFVDDHPFLDALRARGVDASVGIWDDPAVEWSRADAVVLRSIWDYTWKRDAFLEWIARIDAVVPLFNPARAVVWNTHKRYLQDLAGRGVRIVPTAWLAPGDTPDVGAVMDAEGWTAAVVKPAVSAGARNTIRVEPRDAARADEHAATLLAGGDVMVQPYIHETEGRGELSLVHIGGELTHVVRKEPALVGGEYSSSSVSPAEADEAERALARAVLDVVGTELLYARVDVVTAWGQPHLMELEIIEPQLFFRMHPPAAERMAELVCARLKR
ncbi:MAG TPA: hypothetical protein VM600_03740 [Actinomycetota bacterium]|nr:hypothetical protein [Actinomycetota bacterium]